MLWSSIIAGRPCRFFRLQSALAVTLVLTTIITAETAAESQTKTSVCSSMPEGMAAITVQAASAADALSACQGARRAIALLSQHGFLVQESIPIVVTDTIELDGGALAAGIFDRRTGVITVRARAALAAGNAEGTFFGDLLNDDLYISIFAHEVAHAVIEQNDPHGSIAAVAHEYAAYAVQIATLSPDVRARVLARYPGRGFTEPAQINEIVHAMAPHRFAAQAYRHFVRAGGDAAALHRVFALDGRSDIYD